MPQKMPPQPASTIIFLHPDDSHQRWYLFDILLKPTMLYISITIHTQSDIETQIAEWYLAQAERAGIVVLDDVDSVAPHQLRDILQGLSHYTGLTIIVVTRRFPDIDSLGSQLAAKIQYINSNLGIATPIASNNNTLQASAFGIGSVRLNGREIDLIPDTLTHDLLFFVLEHRTVTRDDVIAQIWPHLDHKSAVTNFHVARQKLDTLTNLSLLQSYRGYYQIASDITIQYDVDLYRNLLQEIAYNQAGIQQQNYNKAYALYRYDFLLSNTSAWSKPLRQKLRLTQSDVCYQLAKSQMRRTETLGLLSQAFRYNPYREDVARDMMTIYLDHDAPCDALDVYHVIRTNLWDSQQLEPGAVLKQLHQKAEANCI